MKKSVHLFTLLLTGTCFQCLFLIVPLIVFLASANSIIVIFTWIIQCIIVIGLILLKKNITVTGKWIIAMSIITIVLVPVVSPRAQYILLQIFSCNKTEIADINYLPEQASGSCLLFEQTRINNKEKIEFISLSGIDIKNNNITKKSKIKPGLFPRLFHEVATIFDDVLEIITCNLGKPEQTYYTLRGLKERSDDIWGLVPVNNDTSKVIKDKKYIKWLTNPRSSFPLYIIPAHTMLKTSLYNSFSPENVKGTKQTLLKSYLLADAVFIDEEEMRTFVKEGALDHIVLYLIAWILTIFIPAFIVSKKSA